MVRPPRVDFDVLPAKQIGHAKAVMRIGRKRIEGAMFAVRGIVVARREVIGSECTRPPRQPIEAVAGAELRCPSPQFVGPRRAILLSDFERVVEVGYSRTLEPEAVGLVVEPAGLDLRGGLNRGARRHAPQDEWLQPGVRYDVVDSAVQAVDVVSFLMVADAVSERNDNRCSEDSETIPSLVEVCDNRIVGTGLVAPF